MYKYEQDWMDTDEIGESGLREILDEQIKKKLISKYSISLSPVADFCVSIEGKSKINLKKAVVIIWGWENEEELDKEGDFDDLVEKV